MHSCIFVQDKEQTRWTKMHHTHAWETDFSKMLLWDFKIIRKNIYCENISPSWSLLVHHHARYICQTVTDISHDSHGDVKRILPAAWSTGGGTSSSALVTLPQITSTDTAAPRGVGCSSMFFLDMFCFVYCSLLVDKNLFYLWCFISACRELLWDAVFTRLK